MGRLDDCVHRFPHSRSEIAYPKQFDAAMPILSVVKDSDLSPSSGEDNVWVCLL